MSVFPSCFRRNALVFAALFVSASAGAQSPFSFLSWRSIGPVNTGGRIDDIAVARARGVPDAIYVATASGGLFKSANNGVSWAPVFDRVDAMMSIGAVTVAPSAPLTVWVGTGEANTRQSSSWGDGVYKSTDGGATWARMGLTDTKSVGRIVLDPTDPNIVYVAAQGHLWGPNTERGVFKTTDGGRTWTKVLYVNENTGATDLVIDPANPQVLYAATYQRQRRTWGFNGGGPGSGIYKTTNGGTTWTKLAKGLPAGDMGRIGIALYADDPNVVYATIEAHGTENGIYRTLDAGATWTKTSSLNSRPNYYSEIRIDPRNRERVYTLGSNRGFYFSDDGGMSFTEKFSGVHNEDHALWVDPDNGNHLIAGGDGGVSISWDRGQTWDFRRNMPIGQFYEVDVDNSVPYRVCGGLQDNGVWCMPSAVRNENGIADRDAWSIGGGDGFHAIFDPADSSLVLQSSQNGNAAWVNIETMEAQSVRPGASDRPAAGAGGRGAADAYRWNWDTPIIVSHHDPKTWYMGAQMLFKSTNRGSSWQTISGDLTLHLDRDTLKMMGSVIPKDALSRNDGQENYSSLTSIGESPINAQVLYTGSDDGQVQITKNGGQTWTNITSRIPGLPPLTYVSTVLPSKFKEGRVYATFDGHFTDDYKPYVFVSEDFGATWRSLARGLPETSINRIVEHPTDPDLLVLAGARGVHVSNDRGATWSSLATNMPTVPADAAVFQARDNALVVGTHGRGIWVLDDAGPLEALTTRSRQDAALLLPLPQARLMSTFSPQAWYGQGEFFAPNPQWNSVIQYRLHDAGSSGQATITVKDAAGKVVRTLDGPVAQGINRVVWDLRYAPPVDSANLPSGGGRGGRGGRGGPPAATPVGFPSRGGFGGRGGAPVGPLVLPGTYSVSVAIPGISTPLSGRVTVGADPLPKFSASDRSARQTLLMSIYGWTHALGEAHGALHALALQHDSIVADFGASGRTEADSLNARITRLAGEVDRTLSAVNAPRASIEGWSGLPTADVQRALNDRLADARKALTDLNRLVTTDIPAAYRRVAHKEWTRRVLAVSPPA